MSLGARPGQPAARRLLLSVGRKPGGRFLAQCVVFFHAWCMKKATYLPLVVLLATVLAACGGGSKPAASSGPVGRGDGQGIGHWRDYANLCAPPAQNSLALDSMGQLQAGYQLGSFATEQQFVRAYMNEAYLWYHEVPEVDPRSPVYLRGGYQDAISRYFHALRSPVEAMPGKLKDRFSFVTSTAEWKALSEAGVSHGYGADIAVLASQPPRELRLSLVHEGTPAAEQHLLRGDRLLTIRTGDDRVIDVVNTEDAAEIREMERLLFKPDAGQQLMMTFGRHDGGQILAELKAGEYEQRSVHTTRTLMAADGEEVGYLVLKSFNLPLEGQMLKAMREFKARRVKDVIVDLRYNGGGYLYQAAQLAYMLVDPELSRGKVFERLKYNDKRRADSEAAASILSFMDRSSGRDGTGTHAGEALPNLGLRRIYVLTGGDTCSASESLINGLRGIDAEVVLIGSVTCGKPYGFTAKDNCGMSYFPIEFVGVNDKGVGDFDEGFTPDCQVADDFGRQMGDQGEGLLAAALYHRAHGRCPDGTATGKFMPKSPGLNAPDVARPLLTRGPLHTSKFLLP